MPYLNLVITMLLGGLWHGLTWTFAVWGLLHGVALAATRLWQATRGRNRKPQAAWVHAICVFFTYQFVCLTWVFFRANSLPDAFALLNRIASLSVSFENVTLPLAGVLLLGAAAMFVTKGLYAAVREAFARQPFYAHAAALCAIAVVLQLLGGRGAAPFVYSKF
jgi:D-alanyl-lipoteichoic acid acyltransferase DltB (MBOAT superfamily)